MAKVAIVGCSQSKSLAPFDDLSFEIWGVNNLYPHIPRANRWFEIHEIFQQGETYLRRGDIKFRGQPVNDYLKTMGEWTQEKSCPVYMQRKWDLVPTSIPYPVEEMIKKFGGYFTNSVSWMIALAIHEGAEEIHVYGVDMAVDCLAPETRVLTADLRWVPCGDIQIGDEVMAFDEFSNSGPGKTRRWRKATVTQAEPVNKPCYEIEFEDGTSIIASEKHGWLTAAENSKRWKTTDELITHSHRNGKPTRVCKLTDTWEEDDSWAAGYLAAAFDGEGHFSQITRDNTAGTFTNNIAFSQRENAMKKKVENLLIKYGFRFTDRINKDNDCHSLYILGGKPEIMRLLGLIRSQRLLPKFNPDAMGEIQSKADVAVTGIKYLGIRTVVGLNTSTKTFVAEGFASHNSEYHHQRPSCEYFLGIAVGMGIKVYIPPEADLLKTRFLYGFQEPELRAWNKKVKMMLQTTKEKKTRIDKEIQDIRSRMTHEINVREAQIQQYLGAEMALKESDKIWS